MLDFKRNKKIITSLFKTQEDGSVLTTKTIKIIFPVRFVDVNLANIGEEIHCIGYFAIMDEESKAYGIMRVPSKLQLTPSGISTEKMNGDEYYVLEFMKDTVVFPTLEVVRNDQIVYNILNEFFIMGKLPWYMNYEDLGSSLEKVKEYANSNIGQLPELIEVLASINGRYKEDINTPLRYAIKSTEEAIEKMEAIGLKEVMYTVPGVVNKLLGSYAEDGLTSALIEDPSDISKVELALRK